jgi:protoporphyrinogen oxidase
MAHFWEPICNATLNGHADTLSVSAAGKVFKEGFFRPHGAGLGFFALPLSRVFSAAGSFLHDHGGAVRLQTTVTRILIKKNRAYGVEFVNGERIGSEWIISAVPPFDLLSLLPPAVAANPPFDRVAALQWSPIVNLHLWFDRSVMDEFFFVAVGSPLQVVFNVSRIQGKKGPAHIVVSQSAATEWLDLPLDEIRDRLLTALGALLPAVQGARLLDSLVVKNPRATFLPAPGIEVLRPASRTPIERLLLAGDFTATGWPSTIEGAVRSGNAAARLVSD